MSAHKNPVIDLQPQALDLLLYSGDGVTLKLTCTNPDGAPVDINGAVSAQIRLDRLHPNDPPLVSFTVNLVDAYAGVIRLLLTGVQTKALTDHASAQNGRFVGVWDVEWDPATTEPRTLVQGTVECIADVTRG